jgi:hypothetical protein
MRKKKTILLLPEKTATLQELHERALDFAKRAVFKRYDNLTMARREKLWSDAEWFLTDCFETGCSDWDQEKRAQGMYACDFFSERFEEKYLPDTEKWNHKFCDLGIQPKYFGTLEFVCRSAIDLVDDWAGMCFGWTLGEIKEMYDGKLPPWFPLDGWQYFMDGAAPPVSEWKDDAGISI